MYGRENILDKKLLRSVGGRGTPIDLYFLACMDTTLKSDAILTKFTQDVCMDEKIFQKKNFKIGREGGVPLT